MSAWSFCRRATELSPREPQASGAFPQGPFAVGPDGAVSTAPLKLLDVLGSVEPDAYLQQVREDMRLMCPLTLANGCRVSPERPWNERS